MYIIAIVDKTKQKPTWFPDPWLLLLCKKEAIWPTKQPAVFSIKIEASPQVSATTNCKRQERLSSLTLHVLLIWITNKTSLLTVVSINQCMMQLLKTCPGGTSLSARLI